MIKNWESIQITICCNLVNACILFSYYPNLKWLLVSLVIYSILIVNMLLHLMFFGEWIQVHIQLYMSHLKRGMQLQ